MKTYDIYGIGAALVDIELEVDDDFLHSHGIEKGQMTLVSPENQQKVLASIGENQIKTKKASGGSAANTIFAASNFGTNNFYSCKTANDEAGQFFVHDMQSAGVSCSPNQEHKELPTGTCLVMITPDAERTMNTYLAISESLSTSELDVSAIQQSHFLYMEGYLCTSDSGRNAAMEAKKLAEQHDCKTVMTFSDPAMVKFFKPQLSEMLGQGVDLLFCNEEEALCWTGHDDLQSATKDLQNICKSFAVTLGAKGALVFDGNETHSITPNKVKAVDTNGAGDMFAGAFLYALRQGHDFKKAGAFACLSAAKVVSQFGPRLEIEQHKVALQEANKEIFKK